MSSGKIHVFYSLFLMTQYFTVTILLLSLSLTSSEAEEKVVLSSSLSGFSSSSKSFHHSSEKHSWLNGSYVTGRKHHRPKNTHYAPEFHQFLPDFENGLPIFAKISERNETLLVHPANQRWQTTGGNENWEEARFSKPKDVSRRLNRDVSNHGITPGTNRPTNDTSSTIAVPTIASVTPRKVLGNNYFHQSMSRYKLSGLCRHHTYYPPWLFNLHTCAECYKYMQGKMFVDGGMGKFSSKLVRRYDDGTGMEFFIGALQINSTMVVSLSF